MVSPRASTDFDTESFGSARVAEDRYGFDALVLSAATFFCYLALIWQFSGPTYLMDEIGYLANAATLSGRTIDAGSSYYLGYSLFLLPGFLLFSEPAVIWKSVLVTNSLLFAVSIYLLHRISGRFSDDRRLRIVAVGLCALYPAYPTMAGYAYSTPGIVLVYVAASWTLCQLRGAPKTALLIFGLLVGFLNWIHPSGLPVALAAVITLGVVAWLDRKLIPVAVVSVLTIALMILVFRTILNPHLLDIMTPDGFQPRLHYSGVSDQLAPLMTPGGVAEFLTRFLAQIGIILITSLALASGGAVYIFSRLALIGYSDRRDSTDQIGFLAFVFLSLLGVAALTALIFTKPSIYYNNYWVHGRYIEGVLAPFLLLSILCAVPRIHRLAVTLVVLALLLAFYWVVGQEFGFTDEVELPAFWPQTIFPGEKVGIWFLSGAVACVIAFFVPGAAVKIALAGLYLLCITNQVFWHHQSFRASANPTDLYRLVSDGAAKGSCIAFSPAGREDIGNKPYERFNQLSFYLMNYAYRRMEIADWAENCDGPYLSYDDASAFESVGAVPVAYGLDTGLTVFARTMPGEASHETYSRVFVRGSGDDRPVPYTVRINADDLRGHIGVGKLTGGVIKTTGTKGYVYYGPYGLLKPGKLRVKVYGQASNVEESWVDVASEGGQQIHGVFPLELSGSTDGLLVTGEIDLTADLPNFEIRMFVSSNADIEFSHYDLEIVTD